MKDKLKFRAYWARFLAKHVYMPIQIHREERIREYRLSRAYGLGLSALLRVQEAALRISRTLDGMLRVETLDSIY